jgi:hypothetical protein
MVKEQVMVAGIDGTLWIFVLNTPSGDAGTKPAIKATDNQSGDFVSLLVIEVSGLATGSTLAALVDGTAGGSSGTSSPITNPTYSSSVANEFLVSCVGDTMSATWTHPTGYTPSANNLNGSSFADASLSYANSTGGTESAVWTFTGSGGQYGSILVAFKLASGGGGGGFSGSFHAERPPTFFLKHPGGPNPKFKPRQAAAGAIPAYVPQQYSETLTATVVATDTVGRNAGKQLSAVTTITGAARRLLSKTITATTIIPPFISGTLGQFHPGGLLAIGAVTRQINRPLAATIAVLAIVLRQTQRTLTGTVVAEATVAAIRHRIITLVASLTATVSVQRTIGRILAATSVVTGSLGRSISRTITAVVVATTSVPRNIKRTLTATVIAAGSVTRSIGRMLAAVTVVSATVVATAVTNVISVTLTTSIVVTSNVSRSIGKQLSGLTVANSIVVRKLSRIIAAALVGTGNTVRQLSKTIAGTAAATVSANLIKVKLLTLVTSTIITSGITRTIDRTIQGNLIVAGQTVRSIGRVIPSIITVNGSVNRHISRIIAATITLSATVTRSISKAFSATVTAFASIVATKFSGVAIAGALMILIPGSCAKIIKGLFTQTLPTLIMKIRGFTGTTSTFNITLPVLKTSITAGRNRLSLVIPVIKVNITGKVIHQPLNIKLPACSMTITGKVNHVGSFSIDFGNCPDMWRALFRVPVKLPAPPQPDNVDFITGSPLVNWKIGVPWVHWSTSAFAGMQKERLATEYVRIGVSAFINGAKHNPTGDVVKFAFMPNQVQVPQSSDWKAGSWESSSSILYPYKARCLIGPNGVINLAPGDYVVYLQVTDNPEVPVVTVGTITVY